MPVIAVTEAKEDRESAKYGDRSSFAIGLAAAGAASSQISGQRSRISAIVGIEWRRPYAATSDTTSMGGYDVRIRSGLGSSAASRAICREVRELKISRRTDTLRL